MCRVSVTHGRISLVYGLGFMFESCLITIVSRYQAKLSHFSPSLVAGQS